MKQVNLSNCDHPNKKPFATTRMQLKAMGKFEDVKIVACKSCGEKYSKAILGGIPPMVSVGYSSDTKTLSSYSYLNGKRKI